MKNIKMIKNITRLLSRGCGFAYFVYLLSISFMRAAHLEAFSADDIVFISMFGAIVGILFITEYSLRMLCSAIRKQYKRTV